MTPAEAQAEIVAALVWDVPRLRAGSPSAQHFAQALPGEAERWWESKPEPEDALGRAARGVAEERANQPDQAAGFYRSLIAEGDPWVRLLGLMLRAWGAAEEGVEPIVEARAAVDDLDTPGDLRARLLAKLVVNSFDSGLTELGVEMLQEAIAAAPPDTRLERALAVEGLNAGLPYEWKQPQPVLPPDPLVEYPWIHYDSLDAAQTMLSAWVESRSRRLWAFHFSFGKTPLADAVAAEVQATWAGALWLRRPIRKQLGAQLLTGAASTPRQWAYGVVMWTLGSGANPDRTYSMAEPYLDQEASDFVLHALAETEIAPRYGHRLLSVAVEAWDGLSDETLRWMVERVEPVAGDHPDAALTQRLWAGYAARLEQEWLPRFRALDASVQSSLLQMLGIDIARDFSDESRAAVFAAAAAAVRNDPEVTTHLFRVLEAAAQEPPDHELREAIAKKASPSAIAQLTYGGDHEWLIPGAIVAARQRLIERIKEQAEEARAGTVSFGTSDPRLDLGRLVAGSPEPEVEAIALLMETASDPTLPAEHLLYARIALGLVRRGGKLESSQLSQLHEAEDPAGTFAEHGDISPELLRVQRLHVLARALTSDEAISVVAACRAQDPRVRQVALQSAGEAASAEDEVAEREALAWGLVSGLFDPIDDVVASVVGSVTVGFMEQHRAAGRVALERLPQLLEQTSVNVRASVGAVVRGWIEERRALAEHPPVRSILARARIDRSWIVRKAVER